MQKFKGSINRKTTQTVPLVKSIHTNWLRGTTKTVLSEISVHIISCHEAGAVRFLLIKRNQDKSKQANTVQELNAQFTQRLTSSITRRNEAKTPPPHEAIEFNHLVSFHTLLLRVVMCGYSTEAK
eukprot:m.357415 g.357415  ORF g.357415 m.357415 type:complete len:125 (+) comp17822_c0_seq1:4109-4483(+)